MPKRIDYLKKWIKEHPGEPMIWVSRVPVENSLAPTSIENRDELLNATRSSFTDAGSVGEFYQEAMDQAIQSGHTTDSMLDVLRMFLREAIDVSPTANSLMAKAGQTQITFDNARISLTASQTDETIPATGESDNGTFVQSTSVAGTDTFEISANSGTNYSARSRVEVYDSDFSINEAGSFVIGCGNSTGRYRYVASADVGTRILVMTVTTEAEL